MTHFDDRLAAGWLCTTLVVFLGLVVRLACARFVGAPLVTDGVGVAAEAAASASGLLVSSLASALLAAEGDAVLAAAG